MYQPKPIPTDDVVLSNDILDLAEALARNTHEVWAAGRLADGWTYGPVRDDENKKHPCLVPYDQLTEEEKDYDRRTSLGALKLVLKLGYTVTKTSKEDGKA